MCVWGLNGRKPPELQSSGASGRERERERGGGEREERRRRREGGEQE